MGKGHHKRGNTIPRAVAKAVRLLKSFTKEYLTFLQIASVVNGILVLFNQIVVSRLAYDRDLNGDHSNPLL